jgi:cyclic beta-1,2-glucan synthetase
MENGIGGFAPDGREYVIALEGDRETPLPWSNVLANPEFGTILTASGAAYTWSGNSRENRLTPFANDPITDPTGEAIFIRDEHDGAVWGATPGPLPRAADCGRWVVRHGAGVTHFQHAVDGLEQDLVSCRARRSGLALAAEADQYVGRNAAAQRVWLRRMGARPTTRRRTAVRHFGA